MVDERVAQAEWVAGEAGGQELLSDLRRLYRRNRSHPLSLLLFVLCTTSVGLLYGYRYQPTYEARIALRLTEQDVGVAVTPRPVSELRAFVADVTLSDRTLGQIVDKMGLYPQKRLRGMDQALESLREDIEVEVWRNEALLDEDIGELGRAARVALTFAHKDPDVAFGVVSALADATIAEQRRMRRAQVEYEANGLDPAIAETEQELSGRKLQLSHRGAGLSTVQRAFLPDEIEELEKRLKDLVQSRDDARMRLRAETMNLGLRTEIIDSLRPTAQPFRRRAMTLGGGIGLLIGLLLGGLTIKAFDRRLYDEEDLRRLGFTMCGSLPLYPGDELGSMNSRVRITAR